MWAHLFWKTFIDYSLCFVIALISLGSGWLPLWYYNWGGLWTLDFWGLILKISSFCIFDFWILIYIYYPSKNIIPDLEKWIVLSWAVLFFCHDSWGVGCLVQVSLGQWEHTKGVVFFSDTSRCKLVVYYRSQRRQLGSNGGYLLCLGDSTWLAIRKFRST